MLRTLSLSALILTSAPALAQNPQPAPPANPTVPVAPPNAASPPPEKIAPDQIGSMSNRLSHQKGTIDAAECRSGHEGQSAPEQPRTTPVIPPPGLRAEPSVVPK